jgi:hypothetical protein
MQIKQTPINDTFDLGVEFVTNYDQLLSVPQLSR